MPKGMRGFQKGMKKFPGSGRIKGEPVKSSLSNNFKDQLRRYGFNYDKELARCLKEMCSGKPTPQYSELRALLPFTYPKLKEIDPPVGKPEIQETAMSTERLLEAMSGRASKPEPIKPISSDLPTLEEGSLIIQTETNPEGTIPSVVGGTVEE